MPAPLFCKLTAPSSRLPPPAITPALPTVPKLVTLASPLPALTMRPLPLSMDSAFSASAAVAPAASIAPPLLVRAPSALICKSLPDWMVPCTLSSAPAMVSTALPSARICPFSLLRLAAVSVRSAPPLLAVAIWPLLLLTAWATMVMAPPATILPSLFRLAPACVKVSVPALVMAA